MESTGKFEKRFFKLLENMTSGAGTDGAFGDGPTLHTVYGPNAAAQNISSGDTIANNDARVFTPTGKVQTRKGTTGKKKDKEKKKGVNFATGEENEEGLPEEDAEKKKKADRCKRRADSVYGKKTSAYKSGAIVRCRQGKIWKKKK
tara:strand:- start:90 stop:527 length:438 start_codon:yes stop_codon:yes gene_type:complete